MMTIFRMVIEINGEQKVFFPKSEEKRQKNLQAAKELGYKVIQNEKMYPVGRWDKYQHVFYNATDRAWNSLHDAEDSGEGFDEAEEWLERCEELQGKWDCNPQDANGIVYALYKDYKDMKDIIGGYAYRHGGRV